MKWDLSGVSDGAPGFPRGLEDGTELLGWSVWEEGWAERCFLIAELRLRILCF